MACVAAGMATTLDNDEDEVEPFLKGKGGEFLPI